MQRRELTGRYRHSLGHKVGLHEFRVMLYRRIQRTKDHPWLFRCHPMSARVLNHPDALPDHPQASPAASYVPRRMRTVPHGAALLAPEVGAAGNAPAQDHASLCAATLPLSPAAAPVLTQLPGSQASVAHPRRFVFGGAERFNGLSAQCLYSCTDRHNASSYAPALADRAFHLQFDQAVHFHRIFHGQLFDQRFDEAVDDHR